MGSDRKEKYKREIKAKTRVVKKLKEKGQAKRKAKK